MSTQGKRHCPAEKPKLDNVCRLREIRSTGNMKKREHLCEPIFEAHKSTRKHCKETLNSLHEDCVAEKGFRSLSHYSLVHKPIPLTQEINIPEAQAAAGKEWEKLKKLPA